MKAICFHCHFVAVNIGQPNCPQCGYPLVKSVGSARLATSQITEAFEMADLRPSAAPLPGVIHREIRRPPRATAPPQAPPLALGTADDPVPASPRRIALFAEILSGILLAGLVVTILGLWTG